MPERARQLREQARELEVRAGATRADGNDIDGTRADSNGANAFADSRRRAGAVSEAASRTPRN
jgi:hypothetical protein